MGQMIPIDYSTDIALFLLVLGPIGTVIVAKILMGGGFK
jgi:multisubunit Na+/H+ antiporter MnhF subunit